jgi:hypothetical protein
MNYNKKYSRFNDEKAVLLCGKHHDPIQGICTYSGKCIKRLLCRQSRKIHHELHPMGMDDYEEYEDLTSGTLV